MFWSPRDCLEIPEEQFGEQYLLIHYYQLSLAMKTTHTVIFIRVSSLYAYTLYLSGSGCFVYTYLLPGISSLYIHPHILFIHKDQLSVSIHSYSLPFALSLSILDDPRSAPWGFHHFNSFYLRPKICFGEPMFSIGFICDVLHSSGSWLVWK